MYDVVCTNVRYVEAHLSLIIVELVTSVTVQKTTQISRMTSLSQKHQENKTRLKLIRHSYKENLA